MNVRVSRDRRWPGGMLCSDPVTGAESASAASHGAVRLDFFSVP